MNTIWVIAAVWIATVLPADFVSIRLGIPVALVEIFSGVPGDNYLGFHTTSWIDFLASFGSVFLTFLVRAEIDPRSFRKHLTPDLAIGSIAFLLPFLGAGPFAFFVARRDLRAAEIAGIALSTTSVAVVYTVMVETGLNKTELGKFILSAVISPLIAQTWFRPAPASAVAEEVVVERARRTEEAAMVEGGQQV